MKRFSKQLLSIIAMAIFFVVAANAQDLQTMPVDTAVRVGTLPNGLTYYIRHNGLPKQRANFYIAQRVGSVQEDDAQRGLAHFLEHMCFNGSQNFPNDAITKYCESIGVKMGTNLNAYTSTDETVYNIDDVPVTENNVDSCLLILHDWADGLTLDPKEIDKERGVIHEEWRLRSSATQRILERDLPKLYPGSKYGERMPIGLLSVIDSFKPKTLRAYYEKWYRPDNQGIIVVGDIDVNKVEAQIKKLFSPIVMPANPAKYEEYPVPDNNQPIYVVDKDKEMSQAMIMVMFKHEPLAEKYRKTALFYGEKYMISLACSALNTRLEELSRKPDCPFVNAGSGDDDYLISKTAKAFLVQVFPKPGKDVEALQAAMQEVARAQRFGFTDTELMRARDEFLSQVEKVYDNRDKQQNGYYVRQYVNNFLAQQPIPDITTEFNLYKMLAAQIKPSDISKVFSSLTANVDTNFVVFALYPEKEGVSIPEPAALQSAVGAAEKADLTAYVDKVNNEPLVAQLPAKGKITKTAPAAFGYTMMTLSNGARVYYRKTDFNDSEINFSARSFGGLSLVKDADFVNASLLEDVMNSTGIGKFTAVDLEKKLAGKQVELSPSLGDLVDAINGQSTPKDLRTLFEMIYLRFGQPSNDPEGYENCINNIKTQLENAEKIPETAFSDSISATLYDHNMRQKRITRADLDQANYETIRRIYSERFASAGDFDFYFTGAFDVDTLKAFVEQYIASLPACSKRENFVDLKIYPHKGEISNRFIRSMETPKSYIYMFYTGLQKYSLQNNLISTTLGQILTQRYMKSIREDAGIAYSAGASGGNDYGARQDFTITIACPVKPAKVDSALLLIKQGIDDIAKKGVTDVELDKVKKYLLKTYSDNQRHNSYWNSLIAEQTRWGFDENTDYEKIVNAISSNDVRNFVNNVMLKQDNKATIIMLPADLTDKQ